MNTAVKETKITKDTRIAVLYGGLSNEREVSLRSGANCHNALKRLGYLNAQLIDVDENLVEALKASKAELAFLCLHGRYGEDGTVQGLLELLKIPYTGSGILSSALAMNKPLTKRVLAAQGLPYPKSFILEKHELQELESYLEKMPAPPLMVKPLNEGSSVGVYKIDDAKDLRACVERTIREFEGVIVEEYINGQEITIGVLEDRNATQTDTKEAALIALPILELRPKSKAGFYDYEAKYTKGMTEFVLPAELSANVTAKAQDLAKRTFRALHCSGYARVDMIVDKKGQPFILEVNTLPGMTDTSDLPAMAEVAGISYDQLVERILFSCGLDK